MTVAQMQQAVKFARLTENDRRWFPKLLANCRLSAIHAG